MSDDGKKIAYSLVISFVSTSFIVLVILLIIICRKKRVRIEETLLPETKLSAQPYPLTDIDTATDGFNQRRIVGKGRLGTVYAAVLPNQKLVAVKRIHPRLVLSNAGFGFSSVVKTLSVAQHPNIVSVLGFSQAPGERIIVMEFVGMVSLEFYLQGDTDELASLLDWRKRLRIAAGAARGLEYLHEGIAPNIIHGCVKSSNILLDDNFCARVCDYGLSFLAPNEKRRVSGHVEDEFLAKGSVGYCKETDVYGFGVVLLEILSGKRSEKGWFAKEAIPLIKEMRLGELLDKRVELPSDIKPLVRMARVALACVGNSRESRPSISQVAAILSSLEIDLGH